MNLTQALILTPIALALSSSVAFAQLELDNHRHNTAEDLVNSITAPPFKRGREKSEQVDPSKLRSVHVRNTTFEGSLLDPSSVKLDEDSSGSVKSKSAKASADTKTNDSGKAAETTTADKSKTSKSSDGAGDGHDQKKEITTSPISGRSEEKAAAAKNGDH